MHKDKVKGKVWKCNKNNKDAKGGYGDRKWGCQYVDADAAPSSEVTAPQSVSGQQGGGHHDRMMAPEVYNKPVYNKPDPNSGYKPEANAVETNANSFPTNSNTDANTAPATGAMANWKLTILLPAVLGGCVLLAVMIAVAVVIYRRRAQQQPAAKS